MNTRILFALAAIATLPASAFASSVCLVDAESDTTTCDGKQLNSFVDTKEAYSTTLKNLTDKGYKIASQSSRGEYPFWTLIKD